MAEKELTGRGVNAVRAALSGEGSVKDSCNRRDRSTATALFADLADQRNGLGDDGGTATARTDSFSFHLGDQLRG